MTGSVPSSAPPGGRSLGPGTGPPWSSENRELIIPQTQLESLLTYSLAEVSDTLFQDSPSHDLSTWLAKACYRTSMQCHARKLFVAGETYYNVTIPQTYWRSEDFVIIFAPSCVRGIVCGQAWIAYDVGFTGVALPERSQEGAKSSEALPRSPVKKPPSKIAWQEWVEAYRSSHNPLPDVDRVIWPHAKADFSNNLITQTLVRSAFGGKKQGPRK